MRKIEIQEPQTAEWKDWKTKCKNETEKLKESARNGNELKIKSSIYGDSKIKKSYFVCKDKPFYGKCAYCEDKILGSQDGDIDHFRPKKEVTDAKYQRIYLKDKQGKLQLDSQGNPIPHPGYYWLAYNWRNLLPSCQYCNRARLTQDGKKIGKHSRFPVIGRHAQTSSEVEHEKPLLINPASDNLEDDPSIHLTVNLETFRIEPINNSKRGQACIDIFGLNARDSLIDERKDACTVAKAKFVQFKESGFKDEKAKAALEDIMAGKRPFTMAAQTYIKEKIQKRKNIT